MAIENLDFVIPLNDNPTYSIPGGVLIHSLIKNHRDLNRIKFHILDDQISSIYKKKITQMIENDQKKYQIQVEIEYYDISVLNKFFQEKGITGYRGGSLVVWSKIPMLQYLNLISDYLIGLDSNSICLGSYQEYVNTLNQSKRTIYGNLYGDDGPNYYNPTTTRQIWLGFYLMNYPVFMKKYFQKCINLFGTKPELQKNYPFDEAILRAVVQDDGVFFEIEDNKLHYKWSRVKPPWDPRFQKLENREEPYWSIYQSYNQETPFKDDFYESGWTPDKVTSPWIYLFFKRIINKNYFLKTYSRKIIYNITKK